MRWLISLILELSHQVGGVKAEVLQGKLPGWWKREFSRGKPPGRWKREFSRGNCLASEMGGSPEETAWMVKAGVFQGKPPGRWKWQFSRGNHLAGESGSSPGETAWPVKVAVFQGKPPGWWKREFSRGNCLAGESGSFPGETAWPVKAGVLQGNRLAVESGCSLEETVWPVKAGVLQGKPPCRWKREFSRENRLAGESGSCPRETAWPVKVGVLKGKPPGHPQAKCGFLGCSPSDSNPPGYSIERPSTANHSATSNLNKITLPKSNAPKRCSQYCKQCRPWSDCFLRSSLIWVCTVCPDLSVRKLRIITVCVQRRWLPRLKPSSTSLAHLFLKLYPF